MNVNSTHLDADANAVARLPAREVVAGEDAVKAAGLGVPRSAYRRQGEFAESHQLPNLTGGNPPSDGQETVKFWSIAHSLRVLAAGARPPTSCRKRQKVPPHAKTRQAAPSLPAPPLQKTTSRE